jgi:hypothetical protein
VTPKSCFQCKHFSLVFKDLCIDAKFYGCSNSCTKRTVKQKEKEEEKKVGTQIMYGLINATSPHG